MNSTIARLRRLSSTIAILLVALVMALPAMAGDVLHLKDGRTIEGKIVRELDSGAVFIQVGPGELFFAPDQITKIVRGEPTAEELAEEEEVVIADGATRIAFVTLEEQVGPFFNKDAIERSIEILNDLPENEKPEIVVFEIDSGGGALYELMQIVPYIQEEVKPNYRTVAWIRSAISAAAMTSWVIEEIYMMGEGNIGACTGYMQQGGKTVAMDGEGLEQILAWMETVSVWGQHDPYIMRAMQVYATLSATKNEDGTITWFLDDSGENLISPKQEILTFNSIDAVKWGVAQGIADSKDELAKQLGCHEWVETGHKADEYQQEFRENVGRAQVKIQEHWNKLNIAVQFAEGAPNKRERDRNIGEARRHLKTMKTWVTRAPSLEVYMNLTPEFFRNMERQLKDLAAQG